MKSLPASLLEELAHIPSFNKQDFIAAHQQPASTSIRLHPLKKADLPLNNENGVPWCSYGYYMEERPVFTIDPFFQAGAYYVQEASSMFLEHVFRSLFPEENNLRVLDLCAAPGGKSTLLASLLDEDSLLISNEVIRSRASILQENCVRWGYTNNWITCNDPKDFSRLKGYFDLIIIDAPCSGSGLFRKDEKALLQWSKANVTLCSARQKRIVADVFDSLKENGLLIYATCSYSPQENEEVLDWIKEELDAETVDIPVKEEWNIVQTISDKHQMKGYRFFPDKVKGEGFFCAVIRKKTFQSVPKIAKQKYTSSEKLKQQALQILLEKDWSIMETQDRNTLAIYSRHLEDFQLLKQFLFFRKTGVRLGQFLPKEWIPEHDVAMSNDKKETVPAVEVDKMTALRFLKKENLPASEFTKGWYLVNYKGLSLGWVKSLGNRVNNYLPKHHRIRMELPDEDWA